MTNANASELVVGVDYDDGEGLEPLDSGSPGGGGGAGGVDAGDADCEAWSEKVRVQVYWGVNIWAPGQSTQGVIKLARRVNF